MMLAKPGMGVDEAFSIVGNEQNRLLAMLNRRRTLHETSDESTVLHAELS
ncbi:MAG: methylaspartate ammonia-lyase, partial [Mesorhizobium sp.]